MFTKKALLSVFTSLANVNRLRRLYENYAASREEDNTSRLFPPIQASEGIPQIGSAVSDWLTAPLYRCMGRCPIRTDSERLRYVPQVLAQKHLLKHKALRPL